MWVVVVLSKLHIKHCHSCPFMEAMFFFPSMIVYIMVSNHSLYFRLLGNKSFTRNIERAQLSCVQQIFFQAKHIERRDHSPLISIYSKDWKSSRFQSKAIKTNQEEDLGRELLVKTVTRPSVRETTNRSKINPTKPASSK